MDDDTLQQRIRYLIEHGGLWDDPLADIRYRLGLVLRLSVISLALAGTAVTMHFLGR